MRFTSTGSQVLLCARSYYFMIAVHAGLDCVPKRQSTLISGGLQAATAMQDVTH
jgi:hypothetical protein